MTVKHARVAIPGALIGLVALLVRWPSVRPFGEARAQEQIACTKRGCDSGILVEFETPPTVPYRIEASSSGSRARYVFECEDPRRCGQPFFADFLPYRVHLLVTSEGWTRRYERLPKYERIHPNGPQCDEGCRKATVTIPGV